RAAQLVAQNGLVDHAVNLAQKQHREAVAVHRAMATGEGVVQISFLDAVFEADDVFHGFTDLRAVLTAPRLIPAGHEREPGNTRIGDVPSVAARTERTVFVLLAGEERQAAVDGVLSRGHDHAADDDVLLSGDGRRA